MKIIANTLQIKHPSGMENKRGRPPQKPDYNSEILTRELMDTVTEVYNTTQEIKSTALELDLPPNKIKKLLITAKVLCYPETEQIQRLCCSAN